MNYSEVPRIRLLKSCRYKKISTNEYQITFENQLAIIPDTLVAIVQRNLNQSSFSMDYAVQVVTCSTTKVVYGFVNSAQVQETVISCLGRKLPLGCYTIALQFIPQETVFSRYKTILIGSIVVVLLVLLIRIGYSKKTKTVAANASGETLQIGKYIFHYEQHVVYYEGNKNSVNGERIEVALHFFLAHPMSLSTATNCKKKSGKMRGSSSPEA
jgi:hypothetical protein